MQQSSTTLQDGHGRRFYPTSAGIYGQQQQQQRYPLTVGQCPVGHLQTSSYARWEVEGCADGVVTPQYTFRPTGDGCGRSSMDCLERTAAQGGSPRPEHVYESASFSRAGLAGAARRESCSDHLEERLPQHGGGGGAVLPVYYEVDGKLPQTGKNIIL